MRWVADGVWSQRRATPCRPFLVQRPGPAGVGGAADVRGDVPWARELGLGRKGCGPFSTPCARRRGLAPPSPLRMAGQCRANSLDRGASHGGERMPSHAGWNCFPPFDVDLRARPLSRSGPSRCTESRAAGRGADRAFQRATELSSNSSDPRVRAEPVAGDVSSN